MEFRLAKISGVDDAIISLLMSKRSYTETLANDIRWLLTKHQNDRGFIRLSEDDYPPDDEADLIDWLNKLCKWGLKMGYKKNHETMLRYIDFSIETEGLHKAGMGDLDAHAMRMNNRIIRSATRVSGSFKSGEKSSYYKDKILSIGEALPLSGTGVEAPELIAVWDDAHSRRVSYRFNGFGYVREDCWDDQDVQRGTYMLSIPSDAIWKCNFVDLKHIYAMRCKGTHAHPELQEGMEQLADQIEAALPVLGKGIRNEWVDGPGSRHWTHVNNVKLVAST